MRLTLKLNLGADTYENQEFESNEYEYIVDCYREQVIFLQGWVEFTPFAQPLLDHILRLLGGEKSAQVSPKTVRPGDPTEVVEIRPGVKADSKPSLNLTELAHMATPLEKTKVVQTQNYVDVRERIDYSDKAWKLVGYDGRTTYIAKQHVLREESLEGGGTRVIVGTTSAWVITKLEWK